MFTYRPRRNRKSPAIRGLVQETRLHASDLIYPQFVIEGTQKSIPVESMPGIERRSIDLLLKETEEAMKLGIHAVNLFPAIPLEKKDETGSEAINHEGILQQAIRALRKEFPTLCIMSDIALDPYTTHAHDGVLNAEGDVDNDETVEILVEMALVQAEAGVDMVAPSDMMDGRIGAIRKALDDNGYSHVSIHAYSAKYASAFYGPFRDALSSRLKSGNKRTYQMNPANQREALLEASLDESEGADILMVKPALPYLDVIAKLRETTTLPISAYQVSGEYSTIIAASQKGWMDASLAFYETTMSIKRAGADMIFTYAAPQVAKFLEKHHLF